MLRKHLFLVIAGVVVVVMLVAGAVKLMTGGARGPGGPGGPGGFAGGPPGAAGGGPGGPGGAGGPPGGGFRRGAQVTAEIPQMRTFVDKIEVLGAAKARQSVNVTAPAQQLITRIRFQSGEYVRSGQVLAELKAQEQDAGIAQAESQLKFAKSTWDRWQQLADRGIAPAATAEQYKSAYDQAVANLEAARARLGDRVIRAPFSGTVGLSDAAPGMLINPGATIATLDDMTVMKVDFPVPERFIPVLKDGMAIKATADAYPADAFQGRVAKVDTRLDPASRSVVARAEFPNRDGRLKPGMLLHVTIENAIRRSLAIEEPAVVFENGEAYVLLIQPAPPGQGGRRQGGGPGMAQGGGFGGPPGGVTGGQGAPGGQRQGGGQNGGQNGFAGGQRPNLIAVRHVIGTGLRQDGWVEITSGLQAGQRIVADGTNKVRPNDPVQVAGFGGGAGFQGRGQNGQAGAGFGGPPQGMPAQAGQGGPPPGAAGPPGQGAPAGFPPPRDGAGRPPQAVAGQGGPPGGQGRPGGPGSGFDPMAMFAGADANKDGAVTLDEWTAAGRPEGFFTRLDANGDGKITRAEMQAFTANRAGGGPGGGGGGFQRPQGGPNG